MSKNWEIGPGSSWRALLVSVCAAALCGGCFVVSPGHRDDILSGTPDSGTADAAADSGSGEDAGGDNGGLVDRCGDPAGDYRVLRDSAAPFIVDTRDLVNRVSACGSGSAMGNDGFIAVEVVAGDRWHFHVIPDPATPGQMRDPFLYLVLADASSCDTRACQFSSNACAGSGDEHFAFIAPEDGIWYLGIDDVMPGGGVYQLEAIRLQCGDGTKVHGEACDGGENCNSACQQVLSETRPMEVEANDNPIEANFVELPAGTRTITLGGTIGGDSCTYPDVYSFRILNASNLAVDVLDTGDAVCANGSQTPFDLVLRNSAGEVRAGPMTNATTGCAELRVNNLPAAAYFVHVEHATPIEDRPVPYRMRIALTAP